MKMGVITPRKVSIWNKLNSLPSMDLKIGVWFEFESSLQFIVLIPS